ncbi:MAG: HD family phosphohydrolase [Firmicutes bacterium]|nr:HD family phosphohydrolase [Bacillota bacterium]
MLKIFKNRFNRVMNPPSEEEYEECISDLINHKEVGSMRKFMQHGDTTTLEHSLNVSYYSYRVCKILGLDYRAAARGGLLHDFFLYDWHEGKDYKGLHGIHHPRIALKNAEKHFDLNKKEKDIIKKHMWPLTIKLPRFKESFVVLMMDNYCSIGEVMVWRKSLKRRIKLILGI